MQPTRTSRDSDNDEEEDEFILRIKRTGCFTQHEQLQECYLKTKDWRQCQVEMVRDMLTPQNLIM